MPSPIILVNNLIFMIIKLDVNLIIFLLVNFYIANNDIH